MPQKHYCLILDSKLKLDKHLKENFSLSYYESLDILF